MVLDATLAGISGTPVFNKSGEGVLTLNSVSFGTGYVTVWDGTLRLGTGSVLGTSDFSIITVNGQTAGASTVFDTNNRNFGAYIVAFGGADAQANASNTIMTGSGTLNLSTGGGVSYTRATVAANDPGSAYLTGNLRLLLASAPFAIEDSSNTTTELTVSANISSGGNFGVTKTGAGTLVLSGNNTYTGTTTLSAGTLRLLSSTALGTGTLSMGAGTLELGNNITVGNTVTLGSAARTVRALDGPAAIDATLGGSITGTGGINKTGEGTLRLTGAKAFTGNTTITAGTLQYATQNALYSGVTANWTAARINVSSGATAAFNVGGTGEFTAANIDAIRTLGGAANGFRNGSSIGLDTTNAAGGNFVYSSGIGNTNGGANAVGLTKLGTGTLTLLGSNTYSGNTEIKAGKLVVSGTISNSAMTTISTGAALGGQGFTGPVTINGGGMIAPGNSPGTLTTGSEIWNAGGIYSWELNSATGTVGVNTDLLDIQGTLAIAGTVPAPFIIEVTSLTLANLAGEAGGFDPDENYSWIIASARDGISGFESGKFRIDTANFLNQTGTGGGFYVSQNGNNIVLNYSATIPEPSAFGLIAAAALGLAARRKR